MYRTKNLQEILNDRVADLRSLDDSDFIKIKVKYKENESKWINISTEELISFIKLLSKGLNNEY